MTERTVEASGVRLAVREAGDPDRPTIVLVHGYPDTKELWEPVLDQLQPRFHLAAYDVRGAGGSDAPHGPRAYSLARLGDDLEAVIAQVAGGRPVHLVGHDWGGVAGWEFATAARFEGKLASFTTIAGPSLDALGAELRNGLRRGEALRLLGALWRSWYVLVLTAPGGPTFAGSLLLARGRWRWVLENVERVPSGPGYPAGTFAADARHGANLYRRNILPRLLRPGAGAPSHVPVQLIVPSGDHFISPRYYESATRLAPKLRRRTVAGSHWAPRARPELIARWVAEFVDEVEGGGPASPSRPWVRGGGLGQLPGRLGLVTGAGSGIGRAIARALADHGVRLLLVDRDHETVAQTAAAIPGAQHFTCDVSDGEAMERLAASVLGEHGVPDIVVNNAGIAVAGPFMDTDFSDWRRVLDVNLMGVVHGCRLFGRALVERGEGGHIVNTASAAAFLPTKDLPAYAASKAAVLMLSECLRAEVLPSGIGVTAVCPGIVATNITRVAKYVGPGGVDQERMRDQVSRIYQRRNFTPEQVAAEVVKAIAADRPLAVVTPEAKLTRALSRFAPGLLRRMASVDALPV